MFFVKEIIFFLFLGYYATVSHKKCVYILVAVTVVVNVFQLYLAIGLSF